MAYYGINDVACGKAVMQQLAKAMGDKGGRRRDPLGQPDGSEPQWTNPGRSRTSLRR